MAMVQGDAWDHLCRNTPPQVPTYPPGTRNNPWRKQHTFEMWVWVHEREITVADTS